MNRPRDIKNSPFRILGVFTNTALRERLANINKISAFTKIGKDVSFPADFDLLFKGKPTRNDKSISNAKALLTLPQDQLIYSLFWFINNDPFDDVVLKHLASGDFVKSEALLEKRKTFSGLINKGVLAYSQHHIREAIPAIVEVLIDDKMRAQFLEALGLNDSNVSKRNILNRFYKANTTDIILASTYLQRVGEWDYATSAVIEDLVTRIDSELEKASSIKETDTQAQLSAGEHLKSVCGNFLELIKVMDKEDSIEYKTYADKVALQVLQNAIDYFNNSNDEEAPRKALPLAEYAARTACGLNAKERCNKNLNVIKEEAELLPPKASLALGKTIMSAAHILEIKKGEDITNFILQWSIPLGKIKEECGSNHPFYQNVCDEIAYACLNPTISFMNRKWEEFEKLPIYQRRDAQIASWGPLAQYWKGILHLDALSLGKKCSEWYAKNKKVLRNNLNAIHVDVGGGSYIILTEKEFFDSCDSINQLEAYKRRYPEGRFLKEADQKIQDLKAKEAERQRIAREQERQRQLRLEQERRSLLERIDKCQSLTEILKLYRECSEQTTKNAADNKFFSLCKKRDDFKSYLANVKKPIHEKEAKENSKADHSLWWLIAYVIIGVAFYLNDLYWPLAILTGIAALTLIISLVGALVIKWENRRRQILKLTICAIELVVCALILSYSVKGIAEEKLMAPEREAFSYATANPTITKLADYLNSVEEDNNILKDEKHWNIAVSAFNDSLSKLMPYDLQIAGIGIETGIAGDMIKARMATLIDSLYNKAITENTFQSLNDYKYGVPEEYRRDIEDRIIALENVGWETESQAWQTASERNDLSAYDKYLTMYPKGAHRSTAEKRLIDLQVDATFAGEHGQLPQMDKVGGGYGPTSTIYVYNNTQYNLTLLYSGPSSRRFVLPAHSHKTISLTNGEYRCVASVDASVSNYAGTESLSGGDYSVEYYIQSVPSYGYHHY